MSMFAFVVGNFGLFKGCCFIFQVNRVFRLDEKGKPAICPWKRCFNTELFNFLYYFMLARRPSPKNGHWGAWEPASWESTSCSGSYKTRRRNCDNPSPAYGGRDCVGSSTESMDCDECEYNNGGCEHRCIDYDGRYTCACNSGYKASQSNWKECVRKCTMCINFSFFVS